MKTDLTYNEAYAQLEKLITQLEDDSIQLDTLAEKVNQANELIGYCEKRLRAIQADVASATDSSAGKKIT